MAANTASTALRASAFVKPLAAARASASSALLASPQALYAEQRFSGHNVNIGVRQRREGTGRGF
ncbi:MAG: hypothetical protein DI616_18940, partial [Paracoccus denitrificans]